MKADNRAVAEQNRGADGMTPKRMGERLEQLRRGRGLSQLELAVPLAPGEQYTWVFSYDNNAGIDGDWNVNMTTQLGGSIDIDVSARQYQVNP